VGSVPAPLGPTGLSADPPPVALVADIRGKPRVVALNGAAAHRGVAREMVLAEARALAADLVALPWDEEELARAALEVTTALLAASPRVAWAGGTPWAYRRTGVPAYQGPGGEAGVWWIDAAGLGSEAKLAQRLARIAGGLGFGRARVGIADSAIAAYAAAVGRTGAPAHGGDHHPSGAVPEHHSGTPVRRHAGTPARPVLVPPGDDAAFLAPFPLALLQPGDDIADTCHALGLRAVGQFATLHADEVEARFGPEGLALHRLARGIDTRGPSTPRDDALPLVACDLGSPVATAEPLLFVLRGALASLGAALRAKGLAAREIALTLTLDDGATAEKTVRPARPTSHEGALFDHCRAAFEGWVLPEPVTALAVRATVTVAASGEQGDLLAPRWADPSALAAAFDRIRGSEGADAVATPVALDGHLPQDAGAWRTGADTRTSGRADTPAHRRTGAPTHGPVGATGSGTGLAERAAALRLLPSPVSIRVRLGRAGLEAFHHDKTWHDITAWSGPERLTPKWWTAGTAMSAGPHDYYSARTADGALWLLFRAGASHQWFVEGWWD
jgi:protein ImuB